MKRQKYVRLVRRTSAVSRAHCTHHRIRKIPINRYHASSALCVSIRTRCGQIQKTKREMAKIILLCVQQLFITWKGEGGGGWRTREKMKKKKRTDGRTEFISAQNDVKYRFFPFIFLFFLCSVTGNLSASPQSACISNLPLKNMN